MASQLNLSGGCLCGAVRFRLQSDPFDAGSCHCRTCQLNSGAPAMVFASVHDGDWVATQGEQAIRIVQSSSFGHRGFCGHCGTPLYMKVDHQPETVDFSVTTLDEPDRVAPEFHIFWGSRIAWFDPGDDLPRYERFRPDTRGLEGTEPPQETGKRTNMSFKNPTYQDRVGQAADAKRKALEQLRQRPPRDEKILAERKAAAQKRDAASAEKAIAKEAADAAAAISRAAEAAANAPASEADKKAARDARYAARKNRR